MGEEEAKDLAAEPQKFGAVGGAWRRLLDVNAMWVVVVSATAVGVVVRHWGRRGAGPGGGHGGRPLDAFLQCDSLFVGGVRDWHLVARSIS